MSWERDRIVDLLLEAGSIAMGHRRSLRRELKADASIVTQADREIEDLLTRELEAPSEGRYIIGEETVASKGEPYLERALREEAWVIDPIDGTSPYAHGLPSWGVSIGHMEGGRLVHGGVFLPAMGELVIGGPDATYEALVEGGRVAQWRELPVPDREPDPTGLVGVTQALAKRGRVELRNPVQVLGAAVVPLVGLLQGRFLAYLGSLHLWDAAGVLPLLPSMGFVVTVRDPAGDRGFDGTVDDTTLHLAPGAPRRWRFRGDLLVCRPEDDERMRRALVRGETR